MIGSIEWIEEYVNWLTETAVTYLNIDVAVSGPVPDFSATPELKTIADEILKKVVHPNYGAFNKTLYDAWFDESEGEYGILGSGSDFTGFVHKGIGAVSSFPSTSQVCRPLKFLNRLTWAHTVDPRTPSGIIIPITTPSTGWLRMEIQVSHCSISRDALKRTYYHEGDV